MLTMLRAIISHVYSLSFWMHSDALFPPAGDGGDGCGVSD